MKKLFLSLLISLLLIAVASPAFGAYVLPDPGGRDGWIIDTATGNLVMMRAGTAVGTISTTGAQTITDLAVTDDLTVGDDAAITGLMTVGETLGVTGITTLVALLNANGGIAVDSTNFTVNGTTGAVATASTMAVAGDFTVNTNKFSVTASSGNTTVAGVLDVAGASNLVGAVDVTGDVTAGAGLTAVSPSILYQVIRFCGNGPNAGTETFISPVPFDDTEADFIDGGAGCDGEDDATIGNADEPWPLLKDVAFKPVSMVCTALCTGASAADDVVVFRLMDDTAAVAGMTCSTAALGGDAVAAQCTVTDTTPATVAAGSLLAMGVDNTDDVCNDAGDDFSCLVYVTF